MCKGCNSSNWTNNACSTCGMRRQWAEVVAGSSNPPPKNAPAPNPVAAQLQAVAQKLSQAAGVAPVSPAPSPAAPAPTPSSDAATEQTDPSQKQILDSIKKLEVALAALPEGAGCDAARASVQEQLDARRRQLGEVRPIGKRLDSAQAALSRARARAEAAEESVRLAEQARQAAAAEVQRLEADVAQLQQQVAQVKPDPKPAAHDLAEQLKATVAQLESYGTVSPDAIAEARRASEEIFNKFKLTLDMAAQAATHGTANRRHSHKGPPRPEVVMEPPRRLNGKQAAPKQYISDYFRPAKTQKTSFSQAAREGAART